MDMIRCLQLVASVLGLVFSILAAPQITSLIVCFAVALVYAVILVICHMSGRGLLSSTAHAIIDLVLGIVIIVFTIYIVSTYALGNVMMIVAIVMGFVLPALLFITAYEAM